MACKDEKYILSYCLGELESGEHHRLRQHLKTCPACGDLLREFQETGKLLRQRPRPRAPKGLTADCLQKIKNIGQDIRPSKFNLSWVPRSMPALRWATLIAVFCAGLGLGKLIFNPPTWMEKYGRFVQSQIDMNPVDEHRQLRSYLLSVETLFLDLANMDNPAFIGEEEWKLEMDVTREILTRTRQMKHRLRDTDAELLRLVTEIEWVLEEIVGTGRNNLAGMSDDVRQTIDQGQLLTKIHGYIS
jgi:hypothetical protein